MNVGGAGSSVRAANLAVKFFLELAMLACFAYGGWHLAGGPWRLMAAIGLPLVAVVVWGRWAAPRSLRRLSTVRRVPLEVVLFALAVVALVCSGADVAGAMLAALMVINGVLLTVFEQWDM